MGCTPEALLTWCGPGPSCTGPAPCTSFPRRRGESPASGPRAGKACPRAGGRGTTWDGGEREIRRAHKLGAGGTHGMGWSVRLGVPSSRDRGDHAGRGSEQGRGMPKSGIEGRYPGESQGKARHQPATLSQPRPAKLWGPSKHRKGEKAAAGPRALPAHLHKLLHRLGCQGVRTEEGVGVSWEDRGKCLLGFGAGSTSPHPLKVGVVILPASGIR